MFVRTIYKDNVTWTQSIYIYKINELYFTLIKVVDIWSRKIKILFPILILILEREKFVGMESCEILWLMLTIYYVRDWFKKVKVFYDELMITYAFFVIFSIKINLRPNQPKIQLQFLVEYLSSKLLLKLRHKTASIPCKSMSNYYPDIVHERIQPYKKCGQNLCVL